jgi:hypothetical protein
LGGCETSQLILYQADGTTEITPETEMRDVIHTTEDEPLIVKVVPDLALAATRVSVRGHGGYKTKHAIRSCRAFLTTIALEIQNRYELDVREDVRALTFDDVLWNLRHGCAKPRAPDQQPLSDMFSEEAWHVLEQLNRQVNTYLHTPLKSVQGKAEIVVPKVFLAYRENLVEAAKAIGLDELTVRGASE